MPWPKPVELLAQCPVWDGLDGGTLVVACSGGRDSVALARAAHELLCNPQFRARFTKTPELLLWHLDHGLRPDSHEDAEFVTHFAEQLGVRCIAERAELAAQLAQHGGNMESVARMERYSRLEHLLTRYNAQPARALTAHHLNDQAETVLHHLIRGTRLAGLRGISPVLGGYIFRPWLELAHEHIQAYLHDHDQPYRNDSYNENSQLTRNRLRHEVLPLLEKINPGARAHIARLASMARFAFKQQQEKLEQADTLETLTVELSRWLPLSGAWNEEYVVYRIAGGWFNCGLLADIVYSLATSEFGLSTAVEFNEIESWAVNPVTTLHLAGLKFELPHSDLLICRTPEAVIESVPASELEVGSSSHHGYLQVLLATCAQPEISWFKRERFPWEHISDWGRSLAWILHNTPALPEWRCYLPEDVALPLTLRSWRDGDRIELPGGGTKKLGDIFTDAKIPTCFRQDWAVLADAADKVLWVPALADSKSMQLSPAKPARWLVILRTAG